MSSLFITTYGTKFGSALTVAYSNKFIPASAWKDHPTLEDVQIYVESQRILGYHFKYARDVFYTDVLNYAVKLKVLLHLWQSSLEDKPYVLGTAARYDLVTTEVPVSSLKRFNDLNLKELEKTVFKPLRKKFEGIPLQLIFRIND